MCLGRWKRRGRGAGGLGGQMRWASAARGARSQLPGPQTGRPRETCPGTGASARYLGRIHRPSLDQVRLAYRIMSASRTAVHECRLTATYCVSRSFRPPPKPASRPLSKFYEDSCRQSASCASNSHQAGQHHCESCCLVSGNLLPTRIRPWKRVSAPPNRPCRAPTPKNTTAIKAVNSCPEQSPWQRAAPRCATNRSRR